MLNKTSHVHGHYWPWWSQRPPAIKDKSVMTQKGNSKLKNLPSGGEFHNSQGYKRRFVLKTNHPNKPNLIKLGAGEMAQRLRASVALAEVPGSVLN